MHRVIDPHIHLFNLAQGDYHWLKSENAPFWPDKKYLCQDFSESNLAAGPEVEVAGFVHIEAGFDNEAPWRELEWLEAHCNRPFRSIAFVDLTRSDFLRHLHLLEQHISLVGIRFILDDHAEEYLSNPRVQENLAHIAERGLLFEAQLPLSDTLSVDALRVVLQGIPELQVVVNHAGFFQADNFDWKHSISKLAELAGCSIKCSGWEMLNRQWDLEAIKPAITHIIAQFGSERVMLASNFPVSDLGCSYRELWARYMFGLQIPEELRSKLTFKNAQRIYRLDI